MGDSILTVEPTAEPVYLPDRWPRDLRPRKEVPANPSAVVPILMYHRVGHVPAGSADAIRKDLSVSPEAFESQMAYLADNGFHSVTLQDLLDYLERGRSLPPKPVILTFDDGYDTMYHRAWPVLKRHGLIGVFFVITDFVGKGEYLSWKQIQEMAQTGMDFQSHTRNHRDLTKSSREQITWQLKGSREMLEAQLKRPVRFLSYPAGKYNQTVIDVTREQGYQAAVTIIYGAIHSALDRYEWQRLRIHGGDSLPTFVKKLNLVYPGPPASAGEPGAAGAPLGKSPPGKNPRPPGWRVGPWELRMLEGS
ncbi:MAG: polysaccharide deacetylase family protein [Chloroflexota bacterium]